MAFPNILDLDSLLSPISEELPQGSDIREDRSPTSDYYIIKDARNSARAAERNAMFGDDEIDLITPWRTVADTAKTVLLSKSKDLEVASWYIEALLRLQEWPGFRDGIKLVRRLVEEHWDGLYPYPDEDGIETKVASLTGLNGDGGEGTLITPLRNTPVTEEGTAGAYSIYEYQQARDADRITDEDAKSERIDTLGFSLKSVEDAVATTETQWCLDLISTLEESREDFKALNEKLRELCGNDAPPYTNISKLLDEIIRTVRHMYSARLEAIQAQEAAAAAAESASDASSETEKGAAIVNAPGVVVGPISNREDALRSLEQVAKYFRTYEPHTPLAAGVERLVAWGRMTVSELMIELLPDETARNTYSALTGVRLDGSDNATYTPPPIMATSSSSPSTTAEESPEEKASADSGGGGTTW